MPLAAVTAKKKSTAKKESKPKAGGGGRKKKEKVWSSTLKKARINLRMFSFSGQLSKMQ